MTGFSNEKFLNEQAIMIAELAKSDGENNSTIGQNGEILILKFLKKYLPPQFRAYKGTCKNIHGDSSHEHDIMIADSRFPILNETLSGSVTAMQHAVLASIEIKRTLNKSSIIDIREKFLIDQNQKPKILQFIPSHQSGWSR
jgi:hypothetical protein